MNAGVCSMSFFKESIYDEHLHIHMSRAGLPKIGKNHLALAG